MNEHVVYFINDIWPASKDTPISEMQHTYTLTDYTQDKMIINSIQQTWFIANLIILVETAVCLQV